MKLVYIVSMLTLAMLFSSAHADETLSEKAQSTVNDIKRDANKATHRVEESACTGSDAECAKEKIGNRAEEAKDAVKDKSSEIKNKMD